MTLMCSELKSDRGPSWSWANADGPIKFSLGEYSSEFLVPMLDVDTTPVTEDATGKVKKWFIHVAGHLFSGHISQRRG